jgi:deoxyribodipyrimidine photo-lyase
MQTKHITIYWARRDFRLTDNNALTLALQHSKDNNTHFLPIYILDTAILSGDPHPMIGYPRRLYLSRVLASFAKEFETFNIYKGTPEDVLLEIISKNNSTIFANDDVEPYALFRDTNLVDTFRDSIIFCPDQATVDYSVRTGVGNIYSVFTPFKNAVWNEFISAKPLKKVSLNDIYYQSIDTKHLLFNTKDYSETVLQNNLFKVLDCPWVMEIDNNIINIDKLHERQDYKHWYINQEDAIQRFEEFCVHNINIYKEQRDIMSIDGTSMMSVALKWGIVSPRILMQYIVEHCDMTNASVISYVSELIWREFYKYIIYHNPHVLNEEYQQKLRNIDWVKGRLLQSRLLAWIKGETGYDIVDAAMLQLATTGWMHNRARMIVASFLTKDLGIDWRIGQEYFRAMLLDLDEASNNGGWQWAASTGADPKPMRIFNPDLQAEHYDKDGKYTNKYLKFGLARERIVDHKVESNNAKARYYLSKKEADAARDY